MNFVTLEFATFFLFVLVAGWLLREREGEYRAFLLVCNLFFMRSRAWSLSHCCWPWRCSTGGPST